MSLTKEQYLALSQLVYRDLNKPIEGRPTIGKLIQDYKSYCNDSIFSISLI